jgi:hypothetical protein
VQGGGGAGAAPKAGTAGPVQGAGLLPVGEVPAGNTNGGWTTVSVGNEKRSSSEVVGGGEVVE